MAINDPLNRRQTNTRPWELTIGMQPLENPE